MNQDKSPFPAVRGIGRLAIVALSALAIACSSEEPPAATPDLPVGLHLACQTVECECIQGRETIFTKVTKAELVWKPNGDAACPPGFELMKIEKDVLGRPKPR